MKNKQQTNDLLKAFRESRGQVQKHFNPPKSSSASSSRGVRGRKKTSDPYSSFLEKYANLENTIDSFKTQDLMYFFQEKAKEQGIKYVIANVKRDMAVFKKLQDNYTPREICLMIEFLFFSGQNYLDITNLQPTVLLSGWCNTIYRDSLLWVDDLYNPEEKYTSKKSHTSKREWGRDVEGEKVVIGEWE